MAKDPVKTVLANIKKQMGKSAATLMSEGTGSDIDEVIPTGIEVLDEYVLGVGGLPVGRLIELYGDAGSGKTSAMLQMLAGCQRNGGVAMLAETECALDSERASTFGCDLDRVILLQDVGCIEDTLKSIEEALKALPTSKSGDAAHMIAWDSIAATPSRREVEEGMDGKDKIGERAKALSKSTRIVCRLAMEKRCTLVFINQIRDKPGLMFGDTSTTPGGHAVKFHSSIRLRLYSGAGEKRRSSGVEEHVGKLITFSAAKNKVHPPWRKAKIRLLFETGWDNVWTTIRHAKDKGKIEKKLKITKTNHQAAVEALGWETIDHPELETSDEEE